MKKPYRGAFDHGFFTFPSFSSLGIPAFNQEVLQLFGAVTGETISNGVSAASPVGTVIPYAGPIDNSSNSNTGGYPDPKAEGYQQALALQGWLFCDGSPVPIAAYPELFRVIGFIYGKKDEGHFYLPDFRGRFVRGINVNAEDPESDSLRDPDAMSRQASNSDGWKGNAVGSTQLDALQIHQHQYQEAESLGSIADKGNASFNQSTNANTTDPLKTTDNTSKYPDMAVNTSQETRAKNLYMNFIIKHRSDHGFF